MGWLRRQWWFLTLPREDPPTPELSPVEDAAITELLEGFDTADRESREKAWKQLPPGRDALPLLRAAFPRMRRMEARHSVVYEATFFARVSEDAFQLGVMGCRDRSKFVRDRACGVLAYSLRKDALPVLRPLLRDPDELPREGAEGAVAAIKTQNHHRYWDVEGEGNTFWTVNRGDDPSLPEVGRDIDNE